MWTQIRSARKWFAAHAILAAVALTGYSDAQVHTQEGPFFVSILPANPPTWTYTVHSSGQNELVSVEILSDSNLSDCTINAARTGEALSSRRTETGHNVVLNALNTRTLTASLSCSDHELGEVFLRVTDAGGISRTIGPVAGPG